VTILWVNNKKFVCFKRESSLTARIIRLNITEVCTLFVWSVYNSLGASFFHCTDKNNQIYRIQMSDANESSVNSSTDGRTDAAGRRQRHRILMSLYRRMLYFSFE
jgi:hypothetical protein